jgi:thiamine biosynthesis lipoprotein ApbE
MKRRSGRAIIPLLCAAVLFAGARKDCVSDRAAACGTIVNLTIVADSEEKAAKASQAVFDEIARIERLMSPYDEKKRHLPHQPPRRRRGVVVCPTRLRSSQ